MKKALLILAAVSMGATAFAQGTVGNMIFANRNIPIASGAGTGGGNGNGTYNVPILQPVPSVDGAGVMPGGVTVGLYTATGATPLATTLLRSDTLANSRFFATASTVVDVPGTAPGDTPTMFVRAWQGAGGFAAAKNSPDLAWNEWSFTTKPLGGTPAGGGTPIPTPNMTNWGPEDGSGLHLVVAPEPSTLALGALGLGALLLRRRK